MRIKDENKRQAIYQAAMRVITEQGLAHASMSKIAKAAGVSTSTIYTYFESKEDMLNKLYLMMKEETAGVFFAGFDQHGDPEEEYIQFMRRMYYFFIENPVLFSFKQQFHGSPNISEKTQQLGNEFYAPLFFLVQKAMADGLVIDQPIRISHAYTFATIKDLIWAVLRKEIELDDKQLKKLIKQSWLSVTV